MPPQTHAVKIVAIAKRDTQPPAEMSQGKFKQILRHNAFDEHIGRDEYVGPEGVGYTDFVEIYDGDVTYRCNMHYGPESYRDVRNDAWIEIRKDAV